MKNVKIYIYLSYAAYFLFSMANILAKTLRYWCTYIEEFQKLCGRAMTVEDLDTGLMRVEKLQIVNLMILYTDFIPKMMFEI